MNISYITGNKEKFRETQMILEGVEQVDIDLPEIQEVDSKKIIDAKIEEARNHGLKRFFVDDASLCLGALNGLPGPLIKWFMKTIGNEGLYKIAKSYDNYSVTAKLLIGYMDTNGKVSYFEGETKGRIVEPRGETRFGWDPIFLPDGYNKTFAEMTIEEKNKISHRKIALEKLKEYLDKEL